jgi:hypothetical protein
MGIGDWGLGIGDWGLGPNPQSPSPIPNPQFFNNKLHFNRNYKLIFKLLIKSFIIYINFTY